MERIGAFELGNVIGQGTFCEVRLARHVLTDESAAVKIFRKDQPDKLKQATREWSIMKNIRHPNIVVAYELIQTANTIYMFMEYVERGQLFDYIRLSGKIDQALTAKILWQLLSVLQYLQANNIAHRDLKPQNILLTSNLDVKLADFGLSTRYEHAQVKLSDCCGSPCYALPQMLLGERYNAVDVDVWSMGITLFAMINGHLPFEQTNAKRLHAKIMQNKPIYSEDASLEVRDLITNILSKDIKARYGLKQIKYHRWLVKNNKEQYQVKPQNQIVVNLAIIKQMELFGIESSYSLVSLREGAHNFATTLYQLLEKKIVREGEPNRCTFGTLGTIPSLRDSNTEENLLDFVEMRKPQTSSINSLGAYKTSKASSDFCIKLSQIKLRNQSSPKSSSKSNRTRQKKSKLKQTRSSTSSSTATLQLPARRNKASKRFTKAGNPLGQRMAVNEDYFRQSSRTLRKSKKKVSMYDKTPADFVAIHQYQSLFGVGSKKPQTQKS